MRSEGRWGLWTLFERGSDGLGGVGGGSHEDVRADVVWPQNVSFASGWGRCLVLRGQFGVLFADVYCAVIALTFFFHGFCFSPPPLSAARRFTSRTHQPPIHAISHCFVVLDALVSTVSRRCLFSVSPRFAFARSLSL